MARIAGMVVSIACLTGFGGPEAAEAFTGRQVGHFLFEASLGGAVGAGEGPAGVGAVQGAAGHSVGLTGGVGGKLKGFPPRFFLIGGVESAAWRVHSADAFGEGRLDRRATLATVGLRILFPLGSQRLRLVTEARSGLASVDSHGGRLGLPGASTRDRHGVVALAGGLQSRLTERLSAGVRLDRTWSRDPGADLAAAAAGLGLHGYGRGRLGFGFTLTFHL